MSNLRTNVDVGATVVITVSVLTMLGLSISDRIDRTERMTISNWEELSGEAIQIGAPRPRVVITEFVDFQCPFCARTAPVVDSILAAHPDDVALAVHHFPLDFHDQAVPAAIAFECAEAQNRAVEIARLLFQKQDSLGIKDWASFAHDAGVRDLPAFQNCNARSPDSFPRIQRGLEVGKEVGVAGTPTFWVNNRVTTSDELATEVGKLLQTSK